MGIAALIPLLLGTAMASKTPNALDIAKRQTARPLVIAHRGASHAAPENTVASISLAAELQAVAIEVDVHLTADKVPVIIHDHTLGRTTDGRGKVREKTWSQLQPLDAGTWHSETFSGEGIPSLALGLEAMGDSAIACIEIKTRKSISSLVKQALIEAGMMDRAIVFSFHPGQVRSAKMTMPDVPSLLLVDPGPTRSYSAEEIKASATASKADLIGLDYRAVNAALVRSLQAEGYPVFVYTVDAPNDIHQMMDLGVDAIITNRPRATLGHVIRRTPASK